MAAATQHHHQPHPIGGGSFTLQAFSCVHPLSMGRRTAMSTLHRVFVVVVPVLCSAYRAAALAVTASAASNARLAIELSNKANVDPSYAEEACELWAAILQPECGASGPPLPLGAMPAAHALHASTLVRGGRDKEAISEYQKSLEYLYDAGALSKALTKEEVDIRMGMAKSLQRMLRYREAADTFLGVRERCAQLSIESPGWAQLARAQSVEGAALCTMRVGDLGAAISILENFEGKDADLVGMLGALLLLRASSPNSTLENAEKCETVERARELLRRASTDTKTSSPLYGWLYLTTLTVPPASDESLLSTEEDVYLSFAKVNNSPFDDPGLLNLDDKILLHSFMGSYCDGSSFWPRGYILPREMDSFLAEQRNTANGGSGQKMWMLKDRSGYGSHGNSIATTDEVISMHDADKNADSILCQRIVDPPMLINGKKFSLRIYAVYFPRGKVHLGDGERALDAELYISTEGLAKYAASLYDGNATGGSAMALGDQYMTNSGRGDGRSSQQTDLRQLQNELDANGFDYQEMWEGIEQSIQVVMKRYTEQLHLERSDGGGDSPSDDAFIHNSYAPLCSIPKILGFDYILDSSANPFLLEVNRFPGLEARSSSDLIAKNSIVYDAWVAASERMGISNEYIHSLRPSNYRSYSLNRVPLREGVK